MTNASRMPRRDLLRRVVILCCSFGRILAYYRAWWGEEHQHFLSLANDHPIFWRAVNNNFLDMCILDWCKLFAYKRGKHYWGEVVTDPSAFEVALLRHLGLETETFQNEIDNILYYRDK